MMHRRLQRQLTKCFSALEDKNDIFSAISDSPQIVCDRDSLMKFLNKVNASYEQYERDLTLRSDSLRISSAELIELNERLNQESQRQGELIEAIRASVNGLLEGLGEEKIQPGLMNAQRITEVLIEVFEELESAHVELQYQKEALDHHAIVILSDKNGDIEYVNSNFCDISGYTKDELLGKNKAELKDNDSERTNLRLIMQQVAQGEVWHGEIREVGKGGQEYWVATTVVPLFDRKNQVEKIITIQTDLTPRKKIEQTLEKERHFLYSITDTMAEGVFTVDADGLCSYFNKEAEHLVGFHRDEVIGKNLLSVLNARDENGTELTDNSHPLWQKYRKNKRFRSESLLFSTKQGEEFNVSLGIVPVHSNDTDYGMVGVFHNITGRRKSERRLEQAKETAERKTQRKSDFIANMSHEIRTPLNAIIGLSHIALSNEKNPSQRQQLGKIYQSGKALLHIINDILDFSKIEAGQLTVEHIDFNVQELIENLTTIVTVSAEKKNIELFITKDTNLPHSLIGDPLRISQILLNLTSNAIKFTEKGRVTVHFSASIRDKKHVEMQVSVTDTGIGMTQEQLKRMFLPYSQGDASTTRRFGGSGLGLSISQRLANLMDGHISVESKIGKGSIFRLNLPIERNRQAELDNTTLSLSNKKAILLSASTDELPLNSLQIFGLSVSHVYLSEVSKASGGLLNEADIIFINPPQYTDDHAFLLSQVKNKSANTPLIIFSEALAKQAVNGLLDKNAATYAIAPPLTSSKLWDVLAGIPNFEQSFIHQDIAKESRANSLNGYTVLVVEDNEINQEVAHAIITGYGAEVIIANNGADGISKLEENPAIDIVLMDVQMPVMDGFTATKKIRQNPQFTSIPILALTAHVMKDVLERGEKAGMTDHINKPIDPDDLYVRLVRYLPDKPNKLRKKKHHIIENVEFPDSLPGFDIQASLNRLGNNRALYSKLLKQFVKEFSSSAQKIKGHLESNDIHSAKYEVHHLKGVSGSIGAIDLYKNCRRFESLLHDEKALYSQGNTLCEVLDETIFTIDGLNLATNSTKDELSESTDKVVDAEYVGELAQDSLLLLSQGSAKMLDLLDDWRLALHGTKYQKAYFQLSEQINNFDFLEAENTVNQLINNLNTQSL